MAPIDMLLQAISIGLTKVARAIVFFETPTALTGSLEVPTEMQLN
jgi:hypothetical protein